jgi:mRNA interferase MazF
MVVRRGEIWWATLGEPQDSGPGFRRPVLVVQSNEFNESAIRTSICAAITSNMRLADAPGNVRLTRRASGLRHDSVVNVSQLITLDKHMLTENVGRLPAQSLRDVEAGIKLVLAL